jgi:23S rRNA pseudouridine955/2504/2580 synthase
MAFILTAAVGDDGRRLDRILRKALPDIPLSLIHRFLRKGRILADGKPASGDLRVRSGQIITVPLKSTIGEKARRRSDVIAAVNSLPLSSLIIFENADFLALNKPAGLAAHGDDSLDTLVQAYLAPKIPPSLSFRPGPLHRLDKPTSGIIVFSASLAGAQYFSALLQSRQLGKGYLALVEGVIEKEGVWEDELVRDHEKQKTLLYQKPETNSSLVYHRSDISFVYPHPVSAGSGKDPPEEAPKNALTRFKPLLVKSPYTLLSLEPDTGRTHQIRAQAAAHAHPLAGDRKYGSRLPGELLLHARFLEMKADMGETSARARSAEGSPPWKPAENNGNLPPAVPRLPQRMEAPLPENFRMRVREIFGEDTGY